MELGKTTLQRAFELARSGKCLHVLDIVKHLRDEKYDYSQIEGPALKKQLLALIEEARPRETIPVKTIPVKKQH